ncbi:ARHGAP30 isoform 6 [Pan troglodytes]|uniref:ARHGAP30 isoform 6 n=1 Tax=Pan troglodytes TaxID=9598 RepID=A0A2J8JAL3_PANTR|nr:ARHGAP30 isoform 6 [Pan troglodytes]
MKSRQKGKKKGSAKERVFGCDLQEHLQHSGQEGSHSVTQQARVRLPATLASWAQVILPYQPPE